MADILKGAAAAAIVQGSARTVYAVGITENNRYDSSENRYTDEIESVTIDVVSPATRYKTFSVKVPPGGNQLKLSDEDLEAIAEGGGDFPLVAFEGLTVEMFSRKDSRTITYGCKANSVFHAEENGKPIK